MQQRMTPLDAAFILLERRDTPMHVGVVMTFRLPRGADSAAFVQRVLDAYRADVPYRTPFKHKLDNPRPRVGLPHWVEDEAFDPDHHIRHMRLDPPGEDEQLSTLVARLHQRPLNRRRPLWQMYVIEGLAGGRVALYMKAHHACVDGIGGMRMLEHSLQRSRDARVIHVPWEDTGKHHKRAPGSAMDLLRGGLDAALENVRRYPDILRAFVRLVRITRDPEHRRALLPYTAPDCRLNGDVSRWRMFAVDTLPFATVEAIADAAGATINDVILAICAGSLRHYLDERSVLPRDPLIGMIPVSVRVDGDDAPNRISNLYCDLATSVADPRERLERVRASMRHGKEYLQGLSPEALMRYSLAQAVPYTLSQLLGLAGRMPPPFNVVISNVPGPGEPRYLAGARLESMYPVSVVFGGQGLNITVVSYDGGLHFGLTACRRRVPDVGDIVDGLRPAMDELADACGVRSRQRRSA